MDVARRVLCASGLLHVLEFARVPRLPGRSLDVCHGDEYDGVVVDYNALPFHLVCFDSGLLNCIHELAAEVKLRRNERLVLITRARRSAALRTVLKSVWSSI